MFLTSRKWESIFLIVCTYISSATLTAQYRLYFEDFSSQNGKGIYGPTPTIDVSGVNWSVDGSAATLSASDDYAKVVSEIFEFQDTDGIVSFDSPFTSMAGYTDFSLLVDLSESGDLEGTDQIEVKYTLDGGSSYSSGATRSGNFSDDATSDAINLSIGDGSSFGFKIEGVNNADAEFLRFDNLQLLVDTIKGATLTVDASNQANFIGDLDVNHGTFYLDDGIAFTHGLNLLSNSQSTAYEEDFTGQDGKGESGTGTDTSGVNWSVSSTSNLSDEFDYLKVVTVSGNEIFEFRDLTGGNGVWTSPTVDVSSYNNLNLTMEITEVGNQEPSDGIDVEYSLDGGTTFTSLTSQVDDFTSYSLNSAVSNGSNFILRITGSNSADEERHRFDDISLTGQAEAVIGENTGGKSSISGAIDIGRAVDLAAASGGRVELSGVITGSAQVNKIGEGIISLSNSGSTYSGNLVVESGKLEIGSGVSLSGSVTALGTDKSILGGDGSVNSASIGTGTNEIDFISPGLGYGSDSSTATSMQQSVSLNDNGTDGDTSDDAAASIGNFSVSSLILNDGGVYDWEIKDFDGSSAGIDWDLLSFTNLSFGSTGSTFTLNLLPLKASDGTAGAPDNTSNLWAQSGSSFKFLDGPDGGTGITWGDWSASTINDYFVIRSDDFASQTNFYYGDWSVSYENGDFYLNFSAVPEPSTYVMVGALFSLVFSNKIRKRISIRRFPGLLLEKKRESLV